MEIYNIEEKVSNDLPQAAFSRENDDYLGVATQVPTIKKCLI